MMQPIEKAFVETIHDMDLANTRLVGLLRAEREQHFRWRLVCCVSNTLLTVTLAAVLNYFACPWLALAAFAVGVAAFYLTVPPSRITVHVTTQRDSEQAERVDPVSE